MAPMDEDEFERLRSAVAEGHVEGQLIIDEARTGEHRLPSPASRVGKLFWGVLASVLTAAIVGAVGFFIWYGAKGAEIAAQDREIKRHETAIKDLDEKKASKAQLREQIDVWTAAQKSLLDNIDRNNSEQHKAINDKLDRMIFEVRRSGGGNR